MNELVAERKTAIHLLRSGHSVNEVAGSLNRHPNWVRKWHRRYEAEGWVGLKDRSRAPHRHGRRIGKEVRRAIRLARSELEAEAEAGTGLKYIGALAVRTRLKKKGLASLPSKATIERVLREAKMTRPYRKQGKEEVDYPHLKPDKPLQLCQVDIVPHFLTGGERVACFNAIDVVSRYPTGQPFSRRRSADAAEFLLHTWQKIGLPRYTQVDNEGCFSGGATHPYVLGKVVRLALAAGTELVFSPVYHPQSNAYVERFHQDYNKHVWQDTYLQDDHAVQTQSERFFPAYRQSEHHSALDGLSPHRRHQQVPKRPLPSDFTLPQSKLPLHEGRVHFIRRVRSDATVSILNVDWPVPENRTNQGVWATLEFKLTGATLNVYDLAPDQPSRRWLVSHPFPLKEAVLSRTPDTNNDDPADTSKPSGNPAQSVAFLFFAVVLQSARLTKRLLHTIY